MNLFYQPLISQGVLHLDAMESRHCMKVLRKKSGDTIHITDGKGFLYNARITAADIDQCGFEVVEKKESARRDYRIHIAISLLKNPDRLEWFVEKAIEFGVDEITLMVCDRTEKHHFKTERLEKIAVSAMKQSLNLWLPSLNGPLPFLDAIQTATAEERFIAYVDPDNSQRLQSAVKKNGSYLVLIGPEGDFTPAELKLAMERHFIKVSLGDSRLRTETAGLAACHILNLVNSE